jgi:hypothetical protein
VKNLIFTFAFALIVHCTLYINDCNSQWVQMSNGIGTNKSVYSITTIGNNIFAGTLDSGVYKSTNDGINWALTSLNNIEIYCLATNGNTIFAGGHYSGIFASTNLGLNWTEVFHFPSTRFNSLLAIGNTIFTGTDGYGVYISTNNGVNWSQTAMNDRNVWSLAIKDNIVLAGVMQAPVGPRGGVYTSTNYGNTWNQTSLYDRYVYSVGVCGNNIYSGFKDQSNNNYLYKSTNNGNDWMPTSLNNILIYSFANIGTNIFAGGDGVYLSSDNGTSWVTKGEGLPYAGIYCLSLANNYLYAGTYQSSVWRRPLSELLDIQNINTEIPSKFSLSQNYPNPFNSSTIIRFQLSVVGQVSLKLYDALGRELRTLVNESLKPGTYETSFDGTSLNSGIYFYKLITDGFSDTKKMIMIK